MDEIALLVGQRIGGRAAEGLMKHLAMAVSDDTMLRGVKRMAQAAVGYGQRLWVSTTGSASSKSMSLNLLKDSVASLRLYSHPRNGYSHRAGIPHSHRRNTQAWASPDSIPLLSVVESCCSCCWRQDEPVLIMVIGYYPVWIYRITLRLPLTTFMLKSCMI
jgi:hypothetical protein